MTGEMQALKAMAKLVLNKSKSARVSRSRTIKRMRSTGRPIPEVEATTADEDEDGSEVLLFGELWLPIVCTFDFLQQKFNFQI